MRTLFRLRTKADLTGDDQRTQLTFGTVVVSGNGWAVSPVKEPSRFLAEDVLDFLNAGVLRRGLNQPLNLPLELNCLLTKVQGTQLLSTQFHNSNQ